MKNIILFSIVVLMSCVKAKNKTENNENAKTTTYYFIRHAEKDRTDASNQNPELTDEGHQRALKWSEYFKNIDFDAVYSSNFTRTKQTATPTAKNNNLELTIYNPGDIDYEQFLKETEGQTVLIVGHSDTTPKFVNSILQENKYKPIDDAINSKLFIVEIQDGKISDNVLNIN